MNPRAKKSNLLFIPAIVGYIGVAIAGILNLDLPVQREWAAVLLVGFGILMFLPDSTRARSWKHHLILAAQLALVAGLMVMQPGWSVFPILLFLISPDALIHFPNKLGVMWVGIFTLVTALIFVGFKGLDGLLQLVPYTAGYSFFAIFGWTSVQATKDRARSEQLLAELQVAHAQLQEYADRLEELTITQERNRIAREMHDALGHRLTVSSVQLEGAQRLLRSNPERAEQILATVREQIHEGLGELRSTVAILRAPLDEALPLEQALPRLANQIQEATGMQVHLSLEECSEPLTAAYRQALYRAAQEGLTNIQRHARASEAWLQLNQRDGRLTLLIGDNGVGMAAEGGRSGFGLTGLKERAALLGGEFFVDPRPGGGTQLTFRLPLEPEGQGAAQARDPAAVDCVSSSKDLGEAA